MEEKKIIIVAVFIVTIVGVVLRLPLKVLIAGLFEGVIIYLLYLLAEYLDNKIIQIVKKKNTRKEK